MGFTEELLADRACLIKATTKIKELEQKLADHNKLFRSGVLISAMELHTKIEGLEQQLAETKEKLEVAVKVLEHYAGEPFDTNDIYLDIFDLIKHRGDVTEFDSDTFALRARQALEKSKENK